MRIRKLVVVVIGAGFLLLGPRLSQAETVMVRVRGLNVRPKPGVRHPRLGVALYGQTYRVIRRRGRWVQIHFGPRRGWVHGRHLHRVADQPATSGRRLYLVTAETLFVRGGPSRRHTILHTVRRDTRLRVVSARGEWLRLDIKKRPAWVHGKYVVPLPLAATSPRRRVGRRARRPTPTPRPRARVAHPSHGADH